MVMHVDMVENNTTGECLWIKLHYDGARDAEDSDFMSPVASNSCDRPRAQLEAYID